jgi:hypothetical protein
MKSVRAFSPSASFIAGVMLLTGIALAHGSAQAGMQWKWKDANGATQYSDRPPPPGTPEANILTRPSGSRVQPAKKAPAAEAQASNPALTASAPKAEDPELEARRKKAEAEEAAKKKAEDEKLAKQKVENCQRARSYQRSLQDGMRIVRTNPQGEREVLDDKARAEETQRTQESIQANCK